MIICPTEKSLSRAKEAFETLYMRNGSSITWVVVDEFDMYEPIKPTTKRKPKPFYRQGERW